MSAAISCTRAAAPRLTIRTLRCHRLASTQAVAAAPEKPELSIEPAPVASVTTATPAGLGRKNTRAPTLAERMHKALYPDLYANGRPIDGVQLPKERKAKAADKKPRSTYPVVPPSQCHNTGVYIDSYDLLQPAVTPGKHRESQR